MKKSDKPLIIDNLAKQIQEAKSVTVLNYQGMPTKQLVDLRQKVREAGGIFLVAKNTLIKLALEKADKALVSGNGVVEEGLNGPTAVVFASEDEIAPLQVLGKSVTETEFPKLKFGIFDGAVMGMDKLIALSKLPGKNVLQTRLLGFLVAPKYNLVGTLNGNLQKLVYILSERQKSLSQ